MSGVIISVIYAVITIYAIHIDDIKELRKMFSCKYKARQREIAKMEEAKMNVSDK